MQANNLKLFVEINNSHYIFAAVEHKNSENIKIIEKIIRPSEGIDKNKFINIKQASEEIKKNVDLIEDKLNYIFKEVTIILDNFNCSSLNISGFKKLNGSQVLKENISYILNSLKLAVIEHERNKTILHIFNSKSVLDGTIVENLPIGLFGNFYNHELTFFLIENNDLNNIKQVFNINNLNVKKILVKNFVTGTQLIDKNKSIETFFKINIGKDKSHLSFFDKSSFKYVEYFNFGTNIIFRDITKVCSIDNEAIEKILLHKIFKNETYKDNELLEEKYFTKINFRKIKKNLILNIARARVEEITNIILNHNINIKSFKKNNNKVYLAVEDEVVFDNLKEMFKFYILQNNTFDLDLTQNFKTDSIFMHAADLLNYGWKKEAIPITKKKNTLIASIFKSLFG